MKSVRETRFSFRVKGLSAFAWPNGHSATRRTCADSTKQQTGIEITEEVLVVVAVVVAAIAVIVTDGAAIGAVALIVGLIAGVMTLTTTLIEAVGRADAPPINDLVLNATAAIRWADSRDFKLGFVGLNGSLQFGGNPQFV